MVIFIKIYLVHKVITLSYQNFILSSGLKFNKIEIDMNLEKEKSNCFILSGLNLGKGGTSRN